MHTSATCLVVLLSAGLFLAVEPFAAPPRPAAPAAALPRLVSPASPAAPVTAAAPEEQGPSLGDEPLPTPRPLPAGPPREEPASALREEPTPAPREEPAPAPREQMTSPNSAQSSEPREEMAPMPRQEVPPPPRLAMPAYLRSPLPADVQTLHNELQSLRMEREAMLNEQMALLTARDMGGLNGEDSARLRRRVTELLAKAAQHVKRGPAGSRPPAPHSGATPPQTTLTPKDPRSAPPATDPPEPRTERPTRSTPGKQPEKPTPPAKVLTEASVDPFALAQTLYLAGDHAGALKVYRQLEREERSAEERLNIQFMLACCLRKLGKVDEAAILYREVANSGGNEALVENAQWHLRAMKERRELEAQLEQMRQRRKSITPRKP